jgi:hypothetical protein
MKTNNGHVRKMVLVPAAAVPSNSGSTLNTVSLVPSVEHHARQTVESSNFLERHIHNLDDEIEKVLRDKTLTVEEKLNKYYSLLRSYMLFRAQLNMQQSESIPVHIVKQPGSTEQQQLDEEDEGVVVEQEHKVYKERMPFAKTHIISWLSGNHKKKGKDLLDSLSKNKHFSWNKTTGQITIDNTNLPGNANLRDLVLYKLRQSEGMPLIGEPPSHFSKFDQFLSREDIKTDKVARGRRVADQAVNKPFPALFPVVGSGAAAAAGSCCNKCAADKKRKAAKRKSIKGGRKVKQFNWKTARLLAY